MSLKEKRSAPKAIKIAEPNHTLSLYTPSYKGTVCFSRGTIDGIKIDAVICGMSESSYLAVMLQAQIRLALQREDLIPRIISSTIFDSEQIEKIIMSYDKDKIFYSYGKPKKLSGQTVSIVFQCTANEAIITVLSHIKTIYKLNKSSFLKKIYKDLLLQNSLLNLTVPALERKLFDLSYLEPYKWFKEYPKQMFDGDGPRLETMEFLLPNKEVSKFVIDIKLSKQDDDFIRQSLPLLCAEFCENFSDFMKKLLFFFLFKKGILNSRGLLKEDYQEKIAEAIEALQKNL